MAGDVKLLGLVSGFLNCQDVVKYVVITFYIAAFIGFVKIIFQYIEDEKRKTTIKFTGPILIGYSILVYTKGGI